MSKTIYNTHLNKITTPYTYLIGWSVYNKWYYGVRYAKNCHPSDLFTSYFTSSEKVKDFIKNNGLPDIIQIRKTFSNLHKARDWEKKVLEKMNVVESNMWLNQTSNKSIILTNLMLEKRKQTNLRKYGRECYNKGITPDKETREKMRKSAQKRQQEGRGSDLTNFCNSSKGKIYIKNDKHEIRIFPELLNQYPGYEIGRFKHQCKICGSYVDISNMGKYHKHDGKYHKHDKERVKGGM